LKYLGRWVYPPEEPDYIVLDLYGMEGKPWQIDKVKNLYKEYKDIRYWVEQYLIEYKKSFEKNCKSKMLETLYNNLITL